MRVSTAGTIGLVVLVLGSISSGCAGERPAAWCDPGPGETRYLLISDLIVGSHPKNGAPWGLNLDGFDSVRDGDVGCGWEDVVAPAPFEITGVDVNFGTFMNQPELGFGVATAMISALQSGEILYVIELAGLDTGGGGTDACVGITIHRGLLPSGVVAPEVATDGSLLAGQRIVLLEMVPPTLYAGPFEGRGRVADGWLEVELPRGIMGFATSRAVRELVLHDAQLRAELGGDGIPRAILGGALEYYGETEFALGDWLNGGAARSTFEGFSDLDDCTRMSTGYFFRAVPVEIGETR